MEVSLCMRGDRGVDEDEWLADHSARSCGCRGHAKSPQSHRWLLLLELGGSWEFAGNSLPRPCGRENAG
eukprot:5678821-Amphidinium_carterae.1